MRARLYPRMRERPIGCRINYAHPLANHLACAFIGDGFGSCAAIDSGYYGLTAYFTSATSNAWIWDFGLRRPLMRFHTDRGTDTGRAIFENKGTWFGTANSCSFWGSTTKTSGEITFVVGTNYSIGGYFVDIDAAYNPRRLYYSASGNFNYINLSFDPIDGKVRHYMVIRKDLVFKVFVNGVLEGQNTLSQNRNLGVWSIGATDGGLAPIKGSVGDVLLWRTDIPAYAAPYLADPDNIDYRIGGIPLLLPPARRWWPVAAAVIAGARRHVVGGGVGATIIDG